MSHLYIILAIFMLLAAPNLSAEESVPAETPTEIKVPMTNARLGELLAKVDPDLTGQAGSWTLKFEGISAQVVTDEAADRMRVIIPIAEVKELDREQLFRLLQANFESALDARYAVARGYVWSTYIHPLSSLDEAELISAIAQTYNVALTYGTSFSSGLFNYGGGDNNSEAFDAIIEKGLRT